ncbi:MAG: hypothetical protein V2A73_22700 [Pseudomonadota bacterium]
MVSRFRRVAAWMAVLLVCLGVIAGRTLWDGRKALLSGDAAYGRGEVEEAIAAWRRAARWYSPAAPHVRVAYGRLESVAREAEQRGDSRQALAAWQAIRSSCLSTRSFYVPYADHLAVANERIAALMASMEGPDADPGKTEEERRAWHQALLSRDPSPSVGWTLVALLGLAGWIGGAVLFAFKGISPEEKLNRRAAIRAVVLIAAGLLTWMLGLYWA